jgi:hypothetical protein
MTDPTVVWIHEDAARGLALVRGTVGTKELLALADVLDVARFSVVGKGWCIPLELAGDVRAAAEITGAIARTKVVGAGV